MTIVDSKYYPQVFFRWMPIWIINNTKMLYHGRVDVSEGIDVKTSKSKECDICHYWFFK